MMFAVHKFWVWVAFRHPHVAMTWLPPLARLVLPPYLEIQTVRTAEDAFSWCASGLRRLLAGSVITPEQFAALASARTITTSTAFSGIGCSETADEIVASGCQQVLGEVNDGNRDSGALPLCFKPEFAIEFKAACQEEILYLPKPPAHVFDDQLSFVPAKVKREVMELAGQGHADTGQKITKALLGCNMLARAWCIKCGKLCVARRAHKHTAGPPCTDHSRMGKQNKFDGVQFPVLIAWIAQRRKLREFVLSIENVVQFGSEVLRRHLGDLYFIVDVVVSTPTFEGWPVTRDRMVAVLYLRVWIEPVLRDVLLVPGQVGNIEEAQVKCRLRIKELFEFMFHRACGCTFAIFMQASEDELAADFEWAESRDLVVQRRESIRVGEDQWRDLLHTARARLNASERKRLVEYCKMFKRTSGELDAFDLGMNPAQRPLRSKCGILHTLIKGMGLTFVVSGPSSASGDRWLVASELLAAQGLPTTQLAVDTCGAECQFSPGRPVPATRSHGTPWQQAGNGMHLNHIGGVSAAILFATSMLGDPQSPQSGSSTGRWDRGQSSQTSRSSEPRLLAQRRSFQEAFAIAESTSKRQA